MLQYRIEKYQYRSILVNIVSISYRSENPGIAHHYTVITQNFVRWSRDNPVSCIT